MTGDDHRVAVEERLGLDGGAPQDLLREARLAFVRIELSPDGGMDAVGADENIGLVESVRSGIAIAEVGTYAGRHRCSNAGKPQFASEIFGSDAFADGAKQKHLQLAAMDRILWPAISGRESSWLAVNQLSEFVAEIEAAALRCRSQQARRQVQVRSTRGPPSAAD